jgi:hypothetical protein
MEVSLRRSVKAEKEGYLMCSISVSFNPGQLPVPLAHRSIDMINILKFPFTPKTCCWVHQPGAGQSLLAVSEMDSPSIRIYDGRGDGTPMYTLDKLHRAPVHLISVGLTFREPLIESC